MMDVWVKSSILRQVNKRPQFFWLKTSGDPSYNQSEYAKLVIYNQRESKEFFMC